MKFRISFWDEFSGEAAQDMGIVAGSETEAQNAAQVAWRLTCEGAGEPVSELEFDGPLAEADYSVDYGSGPRDFKCRFWIHVSA